MKKYFLSAIIGLITAAAFILAPTFASAQTTVPRFGITKNNDNTGRVLNYKYTTVTDATGADSYVCVANAWTTIYRIVLTDGITFTNPTVTNCAAGDNLIIVASAASGTPALAFSGANWIGAGTMTMTTRLRGVIKFIFDGAKWVETGRYVQ
jgi:hypothetical protein